MKDFVAIGIENVGLRSDGKEPCDENRRHNSITVHSDFLGPSIDTGLSISVPRCARAGWKQVCALGRYLPEHCINPAPQAAILRASR